MPLPIAPVAVAAARYGTLFAVAYFVAKKRKGLPRVSEEAAHEDVDDGISVRHHRSTDATQAHADARLRRTIRLGPNGPGFEFDASALGRIRIKRI